MSAATRAVVAVLGLACAASPASATQLPRGFEESAVVKGLDAPTSLAWGPDGETWIAGKEGQIWVQRPGAPLTLAGRLSVSTDSERGISGLAVDPEFAGNGWLWVYFTADTTPAVNRLARLTIEGDRVAGATVMLEGPPLENDRHNGGCLRFAADRTLFLTMGDDDQGARTAQDPRDLRGKILRLARDGSAAPGNPFRDGARGDPRVWALGFRNPWRCNLQPGTGALFVGDVGGDLWEELDVVTSAGTNFGWPTVEGPEPAGLAGFAYPIFSYPHEGSGGTAITGGDHARAAGLRPDYAGQYFFGDSIAGKLYRMVLDAQNRPVWTEVWATDVPSPVDIQFGPDGALYYLAFSAGELRRVTWAGEATASVAPTF